MAFAFKWILEPSHISAIVLCRNFSIIPLHGTTQPSVITRPFVILIEIAAERLINPAGYIRVVMGGSS